MNVTHAQSLTRGTATLPDDDHRSSPRRRPQVVSPTRGMASHHDSESALSECKLCPRRCGVDRMSGERGYCRSGNALRLYRWGPHFGEEPPISGVNGAGTIFFSHCTLGCLYCQNYPWSQEDKGEDITPERLAEIMEELHGKGCHNIDLVSPTPWLPLIREAANLTDSDKKLPFVYNSSGFDLTETLDEYSDLIDIALTDLRYSNEDLAAYASGSREYVEAARNALLWHCTHLGPLETDDDDIAMSGVICRLLVLPGHPEDAIDNLRWIADNIGPELSVSIMSQYTPAWRAVSNGDWGRRVAEEEYMLVTDEAESLGFENGWIQPFEMEEDNSLLGCEMTAGEGQVGQNRK